MTEKDSTEESLIVDLFEELLNDNTEKKVMKLILDNKEPEEIIDSLLNTRGK